jgi:hypothetical protein
MVLKGRLFWGLMILATSSSFGVSLMLRKPLPFFASTLMLAFFGTTDSVGMPFTRIRKSILKEHVQDDSEQTKLQLQKELIQKHIEKTRSESEADKELLEIEEEREVIDYDALAYPFDFADSKSTIIFSKDNDGNKIIRGG